MLTGGMKMYGAIIGDLAGSIYEFDQTKKISSISLNKIIEDNSFYSDDTILTIAMMEAILNDGNYEKYLKKYIKEYSNYRPDYQPYFKTAFSPQLIKWCNGKTSGNSKGNGAMMRISPIGYLFDNEQDVIRQSLLATVPSHNSQEAIEKAQTVASIIYYGRLGISKEEIMDQLTESLEYHPFHKFNTTCSETLPNCLYALFSSTSFEESIRKVISYGGDTDTNACIVGAMAESIYGIDEDLVLLAKQKIPAEFTDILDRGYRKVKKLTLHL